MIDYMNIFNQSTSSVGFVQNESNLFGQNEPKPPKVLFIITATASGRYIPPERTPACDTLVRDKSVRSAQ